MENEKHSPNRNAKKTKLKKVVKSIDLGLRKNSEDDEISSKYAFLKDKDMSAPRKQVTKSKRPNTNKAGNKATVKNSDKNNKQSGCNLLIKEGINVITKI